MLIQGLLSTGHSKALSLPPALTAEENRWCKMYLSTACHPSSAHRRVLWGHFWFPPVNFLLPPARRTSYGGGTMSSVAWHRLSHGEGVWDGGMGGPIGAWAQSFRNKKIHKRFLITVYCLQISTKSDQANYSNWFDCRRASEWCPTVIFFFLTGQWLN